MGAADEKRGEKLLIRSINRKRPLLKVEILVVIMVFGLLWGWRGAEMVTGGQPITILVPMLQHVRVPDRSKMLVALTFDDGPDPNMTPRILDILKEKNAVATFFELGQRMQNYPEITERVVEEGHEVESHTMSHRDLSRLSEEGIRGEMEASKEVFRGIVGREPRFVRPPYGSLSATARRVVDLPMILWTVDTLDWKTQDAVAVQAEVSGAAFDGAIILMHDLYGATAEALPLVIDNLRAAGYELVTVEELVKERGGEVELGVLYGSFKP